MVGAVGISSASSSVAALEGRIRQDQVQLNDWTTCASAKTAKGQAAIQKLSGEISATKEQMARALQAQSATQSSPMAAAARDAQKGKDTVSPGASASSGPGSLDIWA